MPSERREFDAAAVRLAVAARERSGAGQGDLDPLVRGLSRLVGAQARLSAEEVEDVIAAALVHFIERVRRSDFDVVGAPAMLTTVVQRRAVDAVRRRYSQEVSLEGRPELLADNDIAGFLDQHVDAQAVVAGMDAAWRAGEESLVLLIRSWLDLAQELGRAPTTREAAERFGTSHTQVRRALAAFRSFVPRGGA